jgi:hypothetical protein
MTGTRRAMAVVSWLAILAINLLVIAKYAPRLGVPWQIVAVGYAGLVAVGSVLGGRVRIDARWRPVIFWSVVGGSALAYLVVLHMIAAEGLRVDRWSAMTGFNSSLLAGRFPYLARTHLGSRFWGLPAAYLMGLPFQWLGDVGYLQVVVFVGFATACQRRWGRQFEVVWPVLLLATSPAYLWEIAVRSDLASNALLFALYLFLCERWRDQKTPARMAALGVIGGLFACTRIVLGVPFLVYVIGYFRRDEARAGLLFTGVASGVFAGVLMPFVLWSPRLFMDNNPVALQTVLSLVPLRVAVAAGCLLAGCTAKDFCAKCFAAGMVLFAAVLAIFLLHVSSSGVGRTLWGSGFDISYFDLALPFLLVPLLLAYPVTADRAACVARPGLAPVDGGR